MSDQSEYIWFNGKIIPWNDANVHVMSHVLHYGSGVFEGIKCYSTNRGPAIFRLNEHIKRLFTSAEKYHIMIPYNQKEIVNACINIVYKNKYTDCYIRPIAFYGYDTLGVDPKKCPVKVAIASFYWGAYLGDDGINNGVNITISKWKKYSINSFPLSAKASGQYMNSMLAVQDARNKGYDEAVLLNHDGNVSEGSGQNIFIVKDNEIITNDEKSSILLGVTRESIITIAKNLNFPLSIQNISLEMLKSADEAFFTGSATEVTPISTIDGIPIGDAKPGKITLQLKEKYLDIVHGRVSQYKKWLTFVSCWSIFKL